MQEDPTTTFDLITTHINADFDAMASMVAVSKLYPEAILSFPGSQDRSLRNFFVNSAFFLFNIKKSSQIDFNKIRRLIIVDTRQKKRIGKFAEVLKREDVEIHIYDHHPASKDDIKANLEIVREVGSTTTIIVNILKEKGLPVAPEEATLMCLGIHEDTGSFTYSSTTPADYESAAWLAAIGADHSIISDMLTKELTSDQANIIEELSNSIVIHNINGAEVGIAKAIKDQYVEEIAFLVQKLMGTRDYEILFAIIQMADRIYVIARNKLDDVDISGIMSALGGGGHPQAASAVFKGKTMLQVEQELLGILPIYIRPEMVAKDIMSSPVIFASPEASLSEASQLLTLNGINVLIVFDEDKNILGYITRQLVEKALHFGLKQQKINTYMESNVSVVDINTPLKEIQSLIVKNKLRILPVLGNGKIVGVITRTNLLAVIHKEISFPANGHHKNQLNPKSKNITNTLRERLPQKIFELLKDFGQTGDDLGMNVYLVGGLVRDILLRRENFDVDIVVEEDGIKLVEEYGKINSANIKLIKFHKKFATATIIFKDGFKVDIATARREYYESPGAFPVVSSSSLGFDLYRRDFTINTLAIRLNQKVFGILLDYFNGLNDIKNKQIRVLHNLSFIEDPTRILRAIRFEQRFGFSIDKITSSLIKDAVTLGVFKDISRKRFLQELFLILKEDNPTYCIQRMNEFGIIKVIHPELNFNEQTAKLFENIKEIISWYNFLYTGDEIEPWLIYWYGLTKSISPEQAEDILKHSGYSSKKLNDISAQRHKLNETIVKIMRFEGSSYQLYTMLNPYATEILLFIMAMISSEVVKRNISAYFTNIKGANVQLMGRDLINMGYKTGPYLKKILNRLTEARINGEVSTIRDERALVALEFGHQGMEDKNE